MGGFGVKGLGFSVYGSIQGLGFNVCSSCSYETNGKTKWDIGPHTVDIQGIGGGSTGEEFVVSGLLSK